MDRIVDRTTSKSHTRQIGSSPSPVFLSRPRLSFIQEALNQPTVVITDLAASYPAEALDVLRDAGVRIVDAEHGDIDPLDAILEADAVLVGWFPMTAEVIFNLKRCKVMVRLGVGYDNIDAEAATRYGVPASNVPDYGTNEVADHAVSLALSLARALPVLDRCVREGTWPPKLPYPIAGFDTLTFGVLGLGRIGKAVVERVRPFRFRLIACDPYLPDSEFESRGVRRVDLDAIMADSDILSLHVPLNGETRHLLNAQRLARMKPTAILVNCSRGPVVDTAALAEALSSGRLGAAGIDVFETEPLEADHPLMSCPTALLTPHYAWHSRESKIRLYVMACEEIVRGIRGEPLRSRVG